MKNEVSTVEKSPHPGVSLKHHNFVISYLMDHNVRQAAKRCGITTAAAHRILKKRPVQNMILKKAKEIEEVADITIEQCVNELKRIALFDHKDYLKDFKDGQMTLKDFEEMDTRGIQSMNIKVNNEGVPMVEIKPYDKVSALKELLSHLKGYKGPQQVHFHFTDEQAQKMSGQEVTARYQQIVNPDS